MGRLSRGRVGKVVMCLHSPSRLAHTTRQGLLTLILLVCLAFISSISAHAIPMAFVRHPHAQIFNQDICWGEKLRRTVKTQFGNGRLEALILHRDKQGDSHDRCGHDIESEEDGEDDEEEGEGVGEGDREGEGKGKAPNVRRAKKTSKGAIIGITAAAATTAAATTAVAMSDQLTYFQTMTAGAFSRCIAQTFMHPANTYKTLLQLRDSKRLKVKLTPERLLRGVDAQFILSLPHGAFYFCVIDQVKSHLAKFIPKEFNFFSDFTASTISTVVCSIVSTPQMVLTDRLMAGVYPSFSSALSTIMRTEGPLGFYTGWWPALAQKIPSYGLTWMFFQQLKRLHETHLGTSPNAEASFALGAVAAAGSVAVMIPMDTIKTRLVIQTCGGNSPRAYKGVADCFYRVLREEGVGAFYRSLPPRLMAVVPMIAIQFGVYEGMKKRFLNENRVEARRIAAANLRSKVRKVTGSVGSKAKSIVHAAP